VRGIRHEARQPDLAGVDIDAFRMRENGVTFANVE
jgi:hypothetical protein